MNLSDKTIIVVDYGNYADVAVRLARDYGKVYYYVPYQSAFPRYYSQMVGVGLAGVERIYDFWGKVDEADVIMFCDLFLADWQVYLREKGYAVFGSGYGEELEIYRPEFKDFLKSVDLPVGKYEVINGLTALREHLKTVEDKWVKMNGYLRGQMETWHHENYDLSKPVLDEMEHTLGICKDMEPFTVEDGIDSIAEIGYDGAVIDGEFLKESFSGIEIKDVGFVGAFIKYKDLPEQVKLCNEAVKDIMAEYGYRGFYSNEIRIAKADKKGYYTDATNRCPEPPTSVAMEAYDNFSEMVWEIAHGNVPEVKYSNKWGVEAIITSDWATEEVQAIYFPEEIRRWVKIKNHAIIDGVDYFIPQQNGMKEIGALVFCSNSLDDAILEVKSMAKKIKGYGVKVSTDGIDEAVDKIKDLIKNGIKFLPNI